MSWFILIFLAFVLYHWAVERIVGPNARWALRQHAFEARDSLRQLRIDEKIDAETFAYFQSGINSMIVVMQRIDLVEAVKLNSIEDDEEAMARGQRAREAVSSCAELAELDRAMGLVFSKAILVNSLGILPYLMPVVLAGVVARQTSPKKILGAAGRLRLKILAMPDTAQKTVFPDDAAIA